MNLEQLFDLIDIGIVILDSDLRICKWNKWMETHSEKSAESVIGHLVLDLFPNLNNPGFLRSVKYVMNFASFSPPTVKDT